MKEIKLTIDGKEIQLTEEQLRMLGIEPEKKRKNPFERSKCHGSYYYVCEDNDVWSDTDYFVDNDDGRYDAANYFNDRGFAEQIALHQLLYRKLLKFAYDNNCIDTAEWDGYNPHWAIRYNEDLNKFVSYCQDGYKAQGVYFSSKVDSEQAITEVVEPFIKKHPEFVW